MISGVTRILSRCFEFWDVELTAQSVRNIGRASIDLLVRIWLSLRKLRRPEPFQPSTVLTRMRLQTDPLRKRVVFATNDSSGRSRQGSSQDGVAQSNVSTYPPSYACLSQPPESEAASRQCGESGCAADATRGNDPDISKVPALSVSLLGVRIAP